MRYVTVGARRPECTLRQPWRSNKDESEAVAEFISNISQHSYGLFGHGISLSHYRKDKISVHGGVNPDFLRAGPTTSTMWSGSSGVCCEVVWFDKGRKQFGPFPADIRAGLEQLRDSGGIPGSVVCVGARSVLCVFLTESITWDEGQHVLYGHCKQTIIATTARLARLVQAAATGAGRDVSWALSKGFNGESLPFEVRTSSSGSGMMCIPTDDMSLFAPLARQVPQGRCYSAVELAKRAPRQRYDALIHGPGEICDLVVHSIVRALQEGIGYFTYRDNTMPQCSPCESGDGLRVPHNWIRPFGTPSGNKIHLGYVDKANTMVWLVPAAVASTVQLFAHEQECNFPLHPQVIGRCLVEAGMLNTSEVQHAATKIRTEGGRPRDYSLAEGEVASLIQSWFSIEDESGSAEAKVREAPDNPAGATR